MPITERTLKRWRKEALKCANSDIALMYEGTAGALVKDYMECVNRILRMTQELLDQHLLKKGTK